MLKSRATYFILIITTIILGISSRQITGIPLFVGDILWGLMIYFIMRFLFISQNTKRIIITSLVFCYAIEFSQLYQAPWINNIRHTVLGGLILGEVFLWGDMLCYTIGVGIGILMERAVGKR